MVKWVLKTVMWVVFIAWAALFFFFPANFVSTFYSKFIQLTSGTVFGVTGSFFLAFSAPILLIAFLAIAHLIVSGEEEYQGKKASKKPRYRLWTFPILVDGPFGVVSAAEFIGILLFTVFVIWAIAAYTIEYFKLLADFKLAFMEESILMLELVGLRLGLIGLFCLAFLFLPIARGSVLLRLVDIPFEHATKYHVWLGHLTMALFTFHGLFYIIAWSMQGNLLQEIRAWQNVGIANLPGVISLSAGLLMWVTSLHPVRKNFFELFFYTHQLYVVFIVFLALHVGDFIFTIAAGGIFLFMLDRFLRFCQSRRTVDIISATCLPCGTIELILSKPANLHYNALSFVFIQVRELSWLQWHPFSVSSSPLDGKYHVSVLIKVLGKWTEKLRGLITNNPLVTSKKHSLTASIEGPYGHESPYHLMKFENLILVAGGIGISPFLAILNDILHCIKERKPCLPRNILVVWAVKKSNELSLLSTFGMESICPFFSDYINLEIQAYVTRETERPLEEGKVSRALNKNDPLSVSKGCAMSVLVGTGNKIWSGVYVISSTLGFILCLGLLDIYYINPYGVSFWWYKGLLFLGCMAVGVVVFGGIVIGLWYAWEKRTSDYESKTIRDVVQQNEAMAHKDSSPVSLSGASSTVMYGRRPDFEEIFGSISDRWGSVDVGVIVCGPPTLQTSVARECRSQNLRRTLNKPIFHFNSHSFDL